ncbi:hypothetical protein EK904_002371, partial [Melospiza melodia maxima]
VLSSLSCLSHPVPDSTCACKITVHLLQEADNERMVGNRKLEAFKMCQHFCSTCWIAQGIHRKKKKVGVRKRLRQTNFANPSNLEHQA